MTKLRQDLGSCTKPRGAVRLLQGFVAIMGVLGVLGVAAPSRAQEERGLPLQLPSREGGDCDGLIPASESAGDPIRMHRGEIPGMWFAMPTARLILCEVRELRIRRRELHLVDQELQLWEQQAENYRAQSELAVEAMDSFAGVLGAAELRALEAEARSDAWYRHPGLWFVLGAAAAAAIFAAAVGALGSI